MKTDEQLIRRRTIVRRLLLALVLSSCGAVAVFFLFRFEAFSLRPLWLLAVVLIIVMMWYFDALSFWFLLRGIDQHIPYRKIFAVNMAGTFVAFITPFYAGGAPTFMYFLTQEGMSFSQAATASTARIFVSTALFSLILPLLLVLLGSQFNLGVLWQTLFSLPILLVVLLMVLLILYTRKSKQPAAYSRRIQSWPLRNWLRNVRFRRIWRWSLVEGKKMRQAFSGLLRFGWKNLLLALVAVFFYWLCTFMVAPLLLYSMGFFDFAFLPMFLAQAMLSIVLPLSPTPGGAGAAELGFASVFLTLVPKTMVGSFTLLWRIGTYYISLAVGSLFFFALLRKRRPSLIINPTPNEE
jgi:hypothetical protein